MDHDSPPGEAQPTPLTARQRIMQVLVGTRASVDAIAGQVGLSERQVEEHLPHIAHSLSRDPERRLVMEPAVCRSCGFEFRNRGRVSCPSRCPKCRNESIVPPRYGIEAVRTKHRKPRSRSSKT